MYNSMSKCDHMKCHASWTKRLLGYGNNHRAGGSCGSGKLWQQLETYSSMLRSDVMKRHVTYWSKQFRGHGNNHWAGWSRKVVAAAGNGAGPSLYPRIDPAVIMAVTHGKWLLLGRQARWVTDRYSLLAGVGFFLTVPGQVVLHDCTTPRPSEASCADTVHTSYCRAGSISCLGQGPSARGAFTRSWEQEQR